MKNEMRAKIVTMMTPLQPKSSPQLQHWFSKVTGMLLICFLLFAGYQPEVISVVTPASETPPPMAVVLRGSWLFPFAQQTTNPSPSPSVPP